MATDLATYLATHPTLTDAEMDHAAALAMGKSVCDNAECGGCECDVFLADDGQWCMTSSADLWHPTTDPAQALEFAQATAKAMHEVVTVYLTPLGSASVNLTLDLDRKGGLVFCESAGPSPARALTAACLDAWRAREGV